MSNDTQEPAGGQAYDNAVSRWNNREHEASAATFDSILAEESKNG